MPGRAGPRKLLGLIYEAAERYDPSIEQLSAAITLSPADDLMRQTLADVLLLAKRPADAERVLLAAIEAMPKAGGSHYQLARLYQAMGRNGDAIRAARTRRRIPACARPGSSLRHVGCSLFRRRTISMARLLPIVGGSLANPNVSDAHRKLGQIYLEQSRGAEAAAEFTATLLLDPANAEGYTGRAQVHLRLGEYAEAAKWARRAVMIDAQHAAAHYALGSSLVRLGQVDEGTQVLEEFRRLQAASQAASDHGVGAEADQTGGPGANRRRRFRWSDRAAAADCRAPPQSRGKPRQPRDRAPGSRGLRGRDRRLSPGAGARP